MTRCIGDGLFLETSAQIDRLLNCKPIKDDIYDVIGKFESVKSSQFVWHEFESVVGGWYETVSQTCQLLDDQDRPRDIQDLWAEIDNLLPFFYLGKSLTVKFVAGLFKKFGEKIEPIRLSNTLDGQRGCLLELFFIIGNRDLRKSGLIDTIKCCKWQESGLMHCKYEPNESCRLKILCIEQNAKFLLSLKTVKDTKYLSESKYFQKKLAKLQAFGDIQLLTEICKNPNKFGDTIIFWEVPNNWSVLTKDKAFEVLQKSHRDDLEVLYVRLPRKLHELRCKAKLLPSDKAIGDVNIVNMTPRDVRIESSQRVGRIGTHVKIFDTERRRWRNGRIAAVSAKRMDQTYSYGVRWSRNNPVGRKNTIRAMVSPVTRY